MGHWGPSPKPSGRETVATEPDFGAIGGRRRAVGLAIAVIPGAPGAATGRVLYVNQHNHACSNWGSGSAQRPFCSIGPAAAIVGPGQTVRVAAGSYAENVRVSRSGTSRAPVVFTAAPRAKVIVHGRTSGFTITGKNWVRIIGFTSHPDCELRDRRLGLLPRHAGEQPGQLLRAAPPQPGQLWDPPGPCEEFPGHE